MKSYIGLLVSILFLVSGPAVAQGWAVTPGEGVGAISLGMTSGQVKAIMNPTDVVGSENNPLFIKYGEEFIVQYEVSKVAMISLHSNSFKSKNGTVTWVPYKGAAIGAPWSAVDPQIAAPKKSRKLQTAKGYPEEYYHAYLGLGLGIRTKGGNVVQVDVWDRK